MKSITIHGIDDDLDQKITQKAGEWRLSLNKTIKRILETALEPRREAVIAQKKAELMQFCGTWTQGEAREFEKAIKKSDDYSLDIYEERETRSGGERLYVFEPVPGYNIHGQT